MPLHLLCVFYTGNATKYGSGCIHPSLGQTIHGGELVEPYTRNYLRQEILRSGEFDVCLFVCLLVGSVFCSLYSLWFLKGRPIWGYSCDFFYEIVHRCSAHASHLSSIHFWEVIIKVQGQNRRSENIPTAIAGSRSEISTPNMAIRQKKRPYGRRRGSFGNRSIFLASIT